MSVGLSQQQEVVVQAQQVLSTHAKSFRLASVFLPQESANDAAVVYSFCRLVDDAVDEAPSLAIAHEEAKAIRAELSGTRPAREEVGAFLDVAQRCEIPLYVAHDLLDGVCSDLGKVMVQTDQELARYCYRVAGTVGLMMSKIMKVKDKEALKGAIDLGIAMQLTNIARDVCEDKARNRQYVKHDFSSIRAIISESHTFYEKSFTSISSIPVKSRFSVIVARRVYRKIGDYILKQNNIDNYNKAGKIYVPVFEKVIQTFLSIIDFIKLLFIKNLNYDNQLNHNILEQEINLNERI